MISLLFKIEAKKNKNLIDYLKSCSKFIIFTTIIYIALLKLNIIGNFKTSLKIYTTLNVIIISVTHYSIQKTFFPRIRKDVIISFLPEKSYDYIKGRLLLVLLKWNMPFMIPSILHMKNFFLNYNFTFFISIILFLISWVILNYLIAIYIRYMINNLKGIKKNIFDGILFLIYVIIIILPNALMYNILAKDEFNSVNNNLIKINNFFILILTLMLLMFILFLKCTNRYFQNRIRFIIENKATQKIKKIDNNNILYKILKSILDIFSINLTNMTKQIFIKDIKNFFRNNKITFLFIMLYQLFTTSFLLYIYYESIPNNLFDIINVIFLLQILIVAVVLMPAFLFSNFALRNLFKIDEDLNLLKNYHIKINNNIIIKSKIRLVTVIMYTHVFIFYFIAFITVFNIYACIGIVLSFISNLIIINLINLHIIRHLNNENNQTIFVNIVNIVLLFICVNIFRFLFSSETFERGMVFYLASNIMLILVYWFNYKFNIRTRNKKEKFLVCCK